MVTAAAWKLWIHAGQEFSWPGLVVTALAMPPMYLLARRKFVVADALGSRALRADAMEAVTCGWLSLVVVIGLVAEALTGAWCRCRDLCRRGLVPGQGGPGSLER